MRNSRILFQNAYFTITEDSIFYSLCALVGIPLVWKISSMVNPSISPIWGLSCYILFLDSHIKTYVNRAKGMIKVLWISSIFVVITVALIRNPFLQTIIALLGFLFYKNTHSEKLGPYIIGFINITILTSSPILGVVNKSVSEGLLQVVRFFGEGLVGFFASLLALVSYYILKKIVLSFYGKGGKRGKKTLS